MNEPVYYSPEGREARAITLERDSRGTGYFTWQSPDGAVHVDRADIHLTDLVVDVAYAKPEAAMGEAQERLVRALAIAETQDLPAAAALKCRQQEIANHAPSLTASVTLIREILEDAQHFATARHSGRMADLL
jgi:hypothetical protein